MCPSLCHSTTPPAYLTTALFDIPWFVWVLGNGGVASEGDGGQRRAEEAAADGPRAVAAKVSVGGAVAPGEVFRVDTLASCLCRLVGAIFARSNAQEFQDARCCGDTCSLSARCQSRPSCCVRVAYGL